MLIEERLKHLQNQLMHAKNAHDEQEMKNIKCEIADLEEALEVLGPLAFLARFMAATSPAAAARAPQ